MLLSEVRRLPENIDIDIRILYIDCTEKARCISFFFSDTAHMLVGFASDVCESVDERDILET
jgi:hypothetical protein